MIPLPNAASSPSLDGVALYYPHIDIHDSSWLMASLLLWDRVYRIVPQYVETQDDPTVKRLADAGLVEKATPDDYTILAGEMFKVAIERPLDEGRTMADIALRCGALSGTERTLYWQSIQALPAFRGLYSPFDQAIQIHSTKGMPWVWELLASLGLCQSRDDDWLEICRPFGDLYMTCLAKAMSDRIGAPLLTNQSTYLDWGRRMAFVPRQNGDPLIGTTSR